MKNCILTFGLILMTIFAKCQSLFSGRVFLGGCYDATTGFMHDSLRVKNLIPYLSQGVQTTTGPQAPVDYIVVELRSVTDSAIVESKEGLLLRNGIIVSKIDGVSALSFSLTGAYLVSINHRNHLGVMTSIPVTLQNGSVTTYDFTTQPLWIKPNIINSPVKIIGGVQTLWPGDANHNKNVKYNGASSDKDAVLSALGGNSMSILYGYRLEDVNMDGTVKYNGVGSDREMILQTVGSGTPNNILGQHTP